MMGTEPICRKNDAGVGARNSNSIKTIIAKCILRSAIEPIHQNNNNSKFGYTQAHFIRFKYLLNGTIYLPCYRTPYTVSGFFKKF